MAVAAVQLNFRIPADLNERLEAEAQASGDSKTEVVRKALEAYFNKEGKENVNK